MAVREVALDVFLRWPADDDGSAIDDGRIGPDTRAQVPRRLDVAVFQTDFPRVERADDRRPRNNAVRERPAPVRTPIVDSHEPIAKVEHRDRAIPDADRPPFPERNVLARDEAQLTGGFRRPAGRS